MKTLTAVIFAFGFLFLVAQANAVENPKYARNHALTCGGVVILTEAHTTSYAFEHGYGRLVGGKDGDLGEVTAVRGNSSVVLHKRKDAENGGFFGMGSKKGFGLYEGGGFRLDLMNTVEREEIYLQDLSTGKKVECSVHGDCC